VVVLALQTYLGVEMVLHQVRRVGLSLIFVVLKLVAVASRSPLDHFCVVLKERVDVHDLLFVFDILGAQNRSRLLLRLEVLLELWLDLLNMHLACAFKI